MSKSTNYEKENKKVKRSYVCRDAEFMREVVNYYQSSGESMRDVSEKYSVPVPTISWWCAKFAKEATTEVVDSTIQPMEPIDSPMAETITITMNKEQKERKRLIKDLTVDNIKDASQEQLEALLLEYKSEKERATQEEEKAKFQEFRADLNDEIIKVAEKRFNINIRKKAGTKH